MRKTGRCYLAVLLMIAIFVSMTGCNGTKKAKKPYVKSSAEVKNGTTQAEGKGSEQSEVPLMIGCDAMERNFNPFLAKTSADLQAVNLTQTKLIARDRTGKIVEKGIDGELYKYFGKSYTCYGVADIKQKYERKKGYTAYRITLRDDLIFSDGQPITIDDVIFSIYAFCDTDYSGPVKLGQSNIRGLLNYQANNPMAESYTEEEVKKYIKSSPKALRVWMNKHDSSEEGYEEALRREARLLMGSTTKKHAAVAEIEGIKRLNDYEMRIYTTGYDSKFLEELQIPVCPLHYYGDTTKYQYDAHSFGFARGDLSAVQANKSTPIGAGAYRFIKYESGIAYFMANELYYQGCPNITYVQLKDMSKFFSGEKVTPAKIMEEMKGGTIDIALCTLETNDIEQIAQINSNNKLSGDILETRFMANTGYSYVGLNPDQVKVGENGMSEESRALRQALATVISACRETIRENESSVLVNAPVARDSWLSPEQTQKNFLAYAQSPGSDKNIYKEDDRLEDKRDAAKKTALEWLAKAGYTVEDGQVTVIPFGWSAVFRIQLGGGTDIPGYQLATMVAADLQEMGITLQIETVTKDNLEESVKRLRDGQMDDQHPLQLWYAEEEMTEEPDFAERFSYIEDAEFTEIVNKLERITNAEKRKEWTGKAFNAVQGFVTEVPVHQRRTAMLISSQRVNIKTMTKDITMFYDWTREIQTINMKKKN
ncbi:MAG: hypothetical protein J1E62_08515 [Lachnospiraceae bacterium]|nr:hypothetical protein [Lachnospiraceae bacterium]